MADIDPLDRAVAQLVELLHQANHLASKLEIRKTAFRTGIVGGVQLDLHEHHRGGAEDRLATAHFEAFDMTEVDRLQQPYKGLPGRGEL